MMKKKTVRLISCIIAGILVAAMVFSMIACGGNRAGCCCYDRCAGRCRNILALVELAGTEDRMYTPAIGT